MGWLLTISPIITFSVLPTGLASQSRIISAAIALLLMAGFAGCGFTLWSIQEGDL
jgi:hypothetical protein